MQRQRHDRISEGSPQYPRTDEEAAQLARAHYREHGLPQLETDGVVAPYLAADERVVGHRAEASLARIDDVTRMALPEQGPLYVTNLRFLHIGGQVTSAELVDVGEIVMVDERMLISLDSARGVILDVAQPRQLRVLLAAAKAAVRH